MRSKPWSGICSVADSSFDDIKTGAIDFEWQGDVFHEIYLMRRI